MSENKKLTPEARDKLAAKLRTNLGRSRPQPWLWAVAGMTLTALLLWGLWRVSQPPPPTPPVMLTVFDADINDEFEARLIAPGHLDAKLEGLTIHWKLRATNGSTEADTKTDSAGIARFQGADWPIPPEGDILSLDVSYVDNLDKSRGRQSRAAVVRSPAGCVLASINELAGKDIAWRETPAEKLPAPPAPTPGKRLVVAVGPVDAETYRAMRAWLARSGSDAVLLRNTIADLQDRWKGTPRWTPPNPG